MVVLSTYIVNTFRKGEGIRPNGRNEDANKFTADDFVELFLRNITPQIESRPSTIALGIAGSDRRIGLSYIIPSKIGGSPSGDRQNRGIGSNTPHPPLSATLLKNHSWAVLDPDLRPIL